MVFNRVKIILLSSLIVTSLSAPCFAADADVKDLFENALYGGLVGTLVGTACLAFTSKPSDHLNYISVGAASGVLAGIGYSVAKGSRALVSFEKDNVKFALPTITPEFQAVDDKGHSALMMKAELINGRF